MEDPRPEKTPDVPIPPDGETTGPGEIEPSQPTTDGAEPAVDAQGAPGSEAQPAEAATEALDVESGLSIFQPAPQPIQAEPSAPALSRRAWSKLNRRELLKLSPLVLGGAFLVPTLRDPLLMRGLALSDWASGLLFSKSRLAPTFAASAVAPLAKFPYNGYDVIDPEVDLESWTLTVEGKVERPGDYELSFIQRLPKITQNVRHVCVEGWDVIGNFGGARVSDFLRAVGADPRARFLEVECADDYYESVDMASAVHPQSLLCYEMYGQPLNRGHGAPLRLNMPTKLGYKQAKYVTTLRVVDVLSPKRGYWEDQGYGWFAGM